MHDTMRTQLRSILLADEHCWLPMLQDTVHTLERSPVKMHQALVLLRQRRCDFDPKFHLRIDAMIDRFEVCLRRLASDDRLVRELAGEVERLEQTRRDAETRLVELKTVIATMLGPKQNRRAGAFRITTGPAASSLRVVEPASIPRAFWSLQPDRGSIIQHHRTTGEVVPGTVVNPLRPSVRVSKTERAPH